MPKSNIRKELNGENSKFVFAVAPTFTQDAADGNKKRMFAGVAYSGELIQNHFYWGNVIFDLASIALPEKLPALIDHDRGQRCGYVTESAITEATGFTVKGVLLSNPHGQAVAQESDEGFPWQMSVHINPGSVEEVAPGTTIVVNGRNVTGPAVVFRNSTLTEVSFTATGWDSNTAAVAMSRGGDQQPTTTGEPSMTPEEIAAMQQENAALKASNTALVAERDSAQATLKEFSVSARQTAIEQLFKDTGREFEANSEDVKAFAAMPDDAFAFTAKMLREAAKAPLDNASNAHLFSHAAGAGATPAPVVANPLLADAETRSKQFAR